MERTNPITLKPEFAGGFQQDIREMMEAREKSDSMEKALTNFIDHHQLLAFAGESAPDAGEAAKMMLESARKSLTEPEMILSRKGLEARLEDIMENMTDDRGRYLFANLLALVIRRPAEEEFKEQCKRIYTAADQLGEDAEDREQAYTAIQGCLENAADITKVHLLASVPEQLSELLNARDARPEEVQGMARDAERELDMCAAAAAACLHQFTEGRVEGMEAVQLEKLNPDALLQMLPGMAGLCLSNVKIAADLKESALARIPELMEDGMTEEEAICRTRLEEIESWIRIILAMILVLGLAFGGTYAMYAATLEATEDIALAVMCSIPALLSTIGLMIMTDAEEFATDLANVIVSVIRGLLEIPAECFRSVDAWLHEKIRYDAVSGKKIKAASAVSNGPIVIAEN